MDPMRLMNDRKYGRTFLLLALFFLLSGGYLKLMALEKESIAQIDLMLERNGLSGILGWIKRFACGKKIVRFTKIRTWCIITLILKPIIRKR